MSGASTLPSTRIDSEFEPSRSEPPTSRGLATWAGVFVATILILSAPAVISVYARPFAFGLITLVATVWVALRPSEGAAAGWEIILVAGVYLPMRSANLGGSNPVLVYWALAQALLATVLLFACVFGGGRAAGSARQNAGIFALAAFIFYSLLNCAYSLHLGNATSDIARQLYGVLIFAVFFWAAARLFQTRAAAERMLYHTTAVLTAAAVVYAAEALALNGARLNLLGAWSRVLTPSPLYWAWAAVMASTGTWPLRQAGLRWLVFSCCVLAVALAGSRGDLYGIALAVVLMNAFAPGASPVRRAAAFAVLLLLAAVFAGLGTYLTQLPGALGALAVRFNPVSDASLAARLNQWAASKAALSHHSVWGIGLGGRVGWFFPGTGYVVTDYIDNGWAYVLVKFGIAGTLPFLLFFLRRTWSATKALLISASPASRAVVGSVVLVASQMFGAPIMLQFEGAAVCGVIMALTQLAGDEPQRQQGGLAGGEAPGRLIA